MIGNDIVDLRFFETPLYRHVRYLNRVCSPDESRWIRFSPNPTRELAIVWASKEAAHKLLSKAQGRRHFVPRQYSTNLAAANTPDSRIGLEVAFGAQRASVEVVSNERWVHAIAAIEGSCSFKSKIQEISRSSNVATAPNEESATARRLANELLAEHGHRDRSLSFADGIPVLKSDAGCDFEMDVSLSHHGAFAAAVIARSSATTLMEIRA